MACPPGPDKSLLSCSHNKRKFQSDPDRIKTMNFFKTSLAASLVLLSPFSMALTMGVAGGAGVFHTDNSNLSATNEQDELETRVNVAVGATHSGSSVSTDIAYNVERIDYDKDTQTNQTVTTGDGSVTWQQIPGTLTWNISNSIRDLVRDKSLANTQDNRESRSVSRAGVTYSTLQTRANILSMSLNYVESDYEDSGGQDSERMGATVSLARALTQVSSASLQFNYDDVSSDSGSYDYEYYNGAVRYTARLSRLNYQIQVGYNEQKSDTGQTKDGTSVDINASYSDKGSTWSLALLQNLTDTSVANYNQSISGLTNSISTSSTSTYERSSAELSYSNAVICQNCNWNINALYEQERYDGGQGDNDEMAVKTGLGYAITQRVTVGGAIEYRAVEFDGLLRADYHETRYDLNWQFGLTKKLSLNAVISYLERESDDDLRSYDELRGGLSLGYKFL